MRPDHLLALDVGTQSTRALVFDLGGRVLARAQVAHEPPFEAPQPGWAERDPAAWWRDLVRAVRQLWDGGADPACIAGLALTTQRGTVVCAAEDGTPLRPAIVWPDQRRASAPPALGPWWSAAFAAAGARELLRHLQQQAEANWLAQHEPALWQRCERFVLLSGWLTHRLGGRWVDSAAGQVGYLPFHYPSQRWAGPRDWRWRALAIRWQQLPELVAPGAPLGRLTAAAATELGLPEGLPLVAAAADKACEVLGCAAIDTHVAHLSFGTAASINTTQPRYLEVQRLLPAYPAALPGAFNTEQHIERGFWLVNWFKQEFGQPELARAAAGGPSAEALFDELLAATPPGSLGLTVLPTWSPGLRDPGPEARGAIAGFGPAHTRAHLYRALVEGLCLGLREARERIERRLGHRLTRLVVSGGGSRSDGALQIAADVFGLPAERPAVHDASALGAAMLCAAGLGLHADVPAAVRAMARSGDRFEPDAAAVARYERQYHEVWKPLSRTMRPLNRRLRRLVEGEGDGDG